MEKHVTNWLRLMGFTALLAFLTVQLSAQTFTYTTDSDFDQGSLFNVNHDAPNSDQLQLNTFAEGFGYINIAASNR